MKHSQGHLRVRNGRYQMIIEVWKNGVMIRKAKTFGTEKEARAWGRKTIYEIEQGLATQASLKNRKLSDAIEKYIEEVLPQKPKNARNVEQHLRWWRERLGRYRLGEVTAQLVVEGRDKLLNEVTSQDKRRAPATVVRYISSLSTVFEAAIKEWQWIEKNPVKLIRKPRVSNARARFLSPEDARRLLNSCEESRNPYLHSIVKIALCTGMRRGEILGLRWRDVDFEKKQLVLRETKNGSTRYVPLINDMHQMFRELYEQEEAKDPSYHIFPSLNLERYLDIRTAWEFSLKRAGIEDFRFHDLRHSCASFLAMSGATQRVIAEILGHKDMRMTHRYSHLTQEHLTDQLEQAVGNLMGVALF